jgi:molybdenum cofactor cytidylyltransferase
VIEQAAIALVVLAAGASSRMGRPKQLLPYRGRTLLAHAAEQALAIERGPVYVVVPNDPAVCKALDGVPVEIVVNADAAEGMASSIRAGLHAVMRDADVDAVLITLLDQPLVLAKQLNDLVNAFDATQPMVVAASYAGIAGAPVLFPKSCFNRLLSLRGDRGARSVLKDIADELRLYPLPEAAFDVDTMQDFAHLLDGGLLPKIATRK